jgi:hypothetical protein
MGQATPSLLSVESGSAVSARASCSDTAHYAGQRETTLEGSRQWPCL